jgi:hypothetical protein
MNKTQLCRKLNKEIHALITNKYFPEIPLKLFAEIFTSFGLNTEFLDGVYCGQSGETSQLIPAGESKSIFWRMTWYKMPSGNYEIVAYVS